MQIHAPPKLQTTPQPLLNFASGIVLFLQLCHITEQMSHERLTMMNMDPAGMTGCSPGSLDRME